MPIKTGDIVEPSFEDGLVLDIAKASDLGLINGFNPVRGVYHLEGSFSVLDNNGVSAPAYIDNSIAPPRNQMVQGAIVTAEHPSGGAEPAITYYQAISRVDETITYNADNTYPVFDSSVSDMARDWQLRSNFHEFCMQFDKYNPIDQSHFDLNPTLYDFLVWRKDKREFQTVSPTFVMGQIVGDFVDSYQFRTSLNPDTSANPFDLDQNGSVGVGDLLSFLTAFGQGSTTVANTPSTCSVTFDTNEPYLNLNTIHYHYPDDVVANAQLTGRAANVDDHAFFRWPIDPANITIDTSNQENLFGWTSFSVNRSPSPETEKDYVRFQGPSYAPQSSLANRILRVDATIESIANVNFTPLFLILDGTAVLANGTVKNFRCTNRGWVYAQAQGLAPAANSTYLNGPTFTLFGDIGNGPQVIEDDILYYDVCNPQTYFPGVAQEEVSTMVLTNPSSEGGGSDIGSYRYSVMLNDPLEEGFTTSTFQLFISDDVDYVDVRVGVASQLDEGLWDAKLKKLKFSWIKPPVSNI